MSKWFPGAAPPALEPDAQIKFFVDALRRRVHPAIHARLAARTRELGLSFADDELLILAALDTPWRVQEFLDTQLYYNNDHASVELDETAFPPRRVLQTGRAHCFEGALFAYAVNFLHGYNPRWLLLEASQDSEHNLVLLYDPQTNLFGCNAHSRYPHLDGRRAEYANLRALAESYYPYYFSDRTNNPEDRTLVGYSEPFDLVSKYGAAWIASEEMLWDIYYTYIDDTITFHYLFDDALEPHPYALIRALNEKWIRLDAPGKPFVNVEVFSPPMRSLWESFWRTFDPQTRVPRGEARAIEKQFFNLTGTTPIDLEDNAGELGYFLEKGYRLERLLTQSHSPQR